MKLNGKSDCYSFLQNQKTFKNENMIFIAAEHDSLEALEALVEGRVIVEELLMKNFKGDTPIHKAIKCGSARVLEYFLESITKDYTEFQNERGQTPWEAGKEKMIKLEETSPQSVQLIKIGNCLHLMEHFSNYLTQANFEQKGFSISLTEFKAHVADEEMLHFLRFKYL